MPVLSIEGDTSLAIALNEQTWPAGVNRENRTFSKCPKFTVDPN